MHGVIRWFKLVLEVFIAFCVFGNMIVEFLMFDYICEIDATWTRSEAIVSL